MDGNYQADSVGGYVVRVGAHLAACRCCAVHRGRLTPVIYILNQAILAQASQSHRFKFTKESFVP